MIFLGDSKAAVFKIDNERVTGFDALNEKLCSPVDYSLDYDACSFFLRFGFFPPPYTGIKGVSRQSFLCPDSGFDIEKASMDFPFYNHLMDDEGKEYDFKEFDTKFLSALSSEIDLNKKYLLMLSGGKDSTSLLIGLAELGLKNLVCATYVSGIKEDESADAERMCNYYGYAHVVVLKDTQKEFELTLDCLRGSISPVADPAFPAYLKVLHDVSMNHEFDTVIDGMGNDIYMGHMPPVRETRLQDISLPSHGLGFLWGVSNGSLVNSYVSYLVQSMLMYKTERMFSGSRLSIASIRAMNLPVSQIKTYLNEIEKSIKGKGFLDARALVRGGIYDDFSGCEKARCAANYFKKSVVFPFLNDEFSTYFFSLKSSEKYDAERRVNKIALRKYIDQKLSQVGLPKNEYLTSKGSFRFDVVSFVVKNKREMLEVARVVDEFTENNHSFHKELTYLLSKSTDYTAALQSFLLFSLCAWISDINKKSFKMAR